MRTVSLFFLIATSAWPQGTAADYKRFLEYADTIRPHTAGAVTDLQWVTGTDRLAYVRTTPQGTEYMMAEAGGSKRPAFDHARLAASLTRIAGRTVEPNKLGLAAVSYGPDTVRFQLGDERYSVHLETYVATRLPQAGPLWSGGPRTVELTLPVASPDGKSELFLRNYNLWWREKGKPESAKALSTDGSEGNYYTLAPGMWSPDGTKVATYRTRPGQRRTIRFVESSPSDQVQPRVKDLPYAKPGDSLDIPRPVLFDLANARAIDVANDLFSNPYAMTRIEWRKDSRAFTFQYNQRGHQVYRVVEVDAASGKARALVEERSATFFCYYSKLFREDVNDGAEIIWMSERDGWNHLYLYDGKTGEVKNQMTKGEWVVRAVLGVDSRNRHVYFLASGMDAGKDPYFRHLFRVGFDGTGLRRLTTADADHDAAVAHDFRSFAVSYSRTDLPPVTEIRRLPGGEVIATLEKAGDETLRAAGWRPPESISTTARDGKTSIWGLLYRPSNFDPAVKYPVIEYIYAGPHSAFVPKRFSPAAPMQAMAELGFVVVQIDGMGTSNRSKAFHDVCWKNIGDAGFPDRILWHKAVAAKYGWYDVDRLGIYGHSAGGQNAMGALLFHGDFYKTAVSSAGCHDNRMDKISWNEQWMGWPVGPEYAASSNVEHAHKLKGKLFLAVGEMDTNVDPASTMQVANALVKAKKSFELLVIPGANHGGWGPYWERRRADFLVKNLLGVAPPDWNGMP